MVRKKVTRNPKVIAKPYKVYHKGFFVGVMELTPDAIKRLEKTGYVVKSNPVRKIRVARKSNPKGLTLIYAKVTRIEGTKGKQSAFPGQRFFHNFKRPYPSMYGTTDRKMLIIK